MARWFMPMKSESVESPKGVWTGGGMKAGQNIDRPSFVQIPPMFVAKDEHGRAVRTEIELKPGGISLGLVDHGFWHVGPGEFVDLPDAVPAKSIRLMAPQLLNKEQAVEAGIANEDGTLADKGKKAKEPNQPRPQ